MRRPFCLYKDKASTGLTWHIKFWDESSQRYRHPHSLRVLVVGKKERRREAEEKALAFYGEFKEQLEQARKYEQPKFSAVGALSLVSYLADFWTENSRYVQERRHIERTGSLFYSFVTASLFLIYSSIQSMM
jgi:hypothetical protein